MQKRRNICATHGNTFPVRASATINFKRERELNGGWSTGSTPTPMKTKCEHNTTLGNIVCYTFLHIPAARGVKGYTRFAVNCVRGRRKCFRLFNDCMIMIWITGWVNIAMSVFPFVWMLRSWKSPSWVMGIW